MNQQKNKFPKKILMVCLGNICRSPLAEGILKAKLNDDFIVDSAGTSAYHLGEKPDKRSIEVAKKHGLDISQQQARQFTVTDFDAFDLIYAMDSSNFNNIKNLARTDEEISKIHLILNEIFPNENRQVPDPYWSKMDGFEEVFHLLDKATDAIVEKLR